MDPKEITSADAKSLMMRLKTFAHYIFVRTGGKLPFKCLVQLNQDAVSQNENLIIDNDGVNGANENVRQLMQQVKINLVYDPEKKLMHEKATKDIDVTMSG